MSVLTVAMILANAAEYGIAFNDSMVSKGKGSDKVAVGMAPILTIVDFKPFEAAFPGVILKHSNGQSPRVHGQAICRNMLVANRSASRESMQEAQIKGICLGQAVSVTVKTVTVEKIVEVELGVAKQQAMIADLVERGFSVAEAQQFVESHK